MNDNITKNIYDIPTNTILRLTQILDEAFNHNDDFVLKFVRNGCKLNVKECKIMADVAEIFNSSMVDCKFVEMTGVFRRQGCMLDMLCHITSNKDVVIVGRFPVLITFENRGITINKGE